MTITTNYSSSDWNRAIPNIIITCLPAVFLFWSLIYLYIPYVESFSIFLNFQTEDEMLVRFIDHLKNNVEIQTDYLIPDESILLFFMLAWIGGMLAPIWIFYRFYQLIPTNWIIKKLGIENRMKLVVFKNGKPVRRMRDLLK